VHLLLSPLSWAISCALLLQLGALRRHRRARLGLLAGLGLSVMLFTPLGANALVGWLEGQARRARIERCGPAAPGAAVTAVTAIVLAGGFDRSASDEHDIGALTRPSQARALQAAELHRRGLVQQFVVSGGSDQAVAESSVMAALMVQLGVPAPSIRLETGSRSTWQNATQVAAMLQPRSAAAPLLLVTSALHVPRALLAFDAAGLPTCPAPTQWIYLPPQLALGYLLPQSSALDKADDALHELVGIAALSLRLRGRRTPP
jgi:uncharacterized SAM-binding protein YcdF (DUF218 family)